MRRFSILAAVVVSGAAGLAFGYTFGGTSDVKTNEELAFAYQLHLDTVRGLADHARRNAIEPTGQLGFAIQAASVVVDPRDFKTFTRFQTEQGRAASLARELITTMDGELGPEDQTFAKLVSRFNAEERSLERIHERRHARLPDLAQRR